MEGNSKAPHDIENPYIPLATLMSQDLVGLPPLSDSCCIYRVPEELRRVNKTAYTPQFVSIGPLHHGDEGLKDMEEHKMRYLRYFLDRTGASLEDYVKKIKGKEAELRSFYAHTIELCSDKFVRIILVDAAFVIEFLLRYRRHIKADSNDRIFNKPWLKNYVAPDMLLLENQLPFFILEDLFATAEVPATMPSTFELSCTLSPATPSALQLSCTLLPETPSVFDLSYAFCEVSTSLNVKRDASGSCYSFKVEHFVDLIRTLNLPTDQEKNEDREPVETLAVPSMTELHQAGVRFKEKSSNNLFDICFKDGTLEIPNLRIADATDRLLRNLIAFEQCHCSDTQYFSDYIVLMDCFVNTPNDVELLVKNGIVENMLGDNNEVSTLINSLGKGVVLNPRRFYYATLANNLKEYYKKPWNKRKADLKQKYFNSPWKTISVIAATLIIILTFIQTACSFFQCGQR